MNIMRLLKIVNEENCMAKVKAMQLQSFKEKGLIDAPEPVLSLIDDIVKHMTNSSEAMFNEVEK